MNYNNKYLSLFHMRFTSSISIIFDSYGRTSSVDTSRNQSNKNCSFLINDIFLSNLLSIISQYNHVFFNTSFYRMFLYLSYKPNIIKWSKMDESTSF